MLLGLRMRRIQLEGPLELGNRFIKAALNSVQSAEQVTSIGVVWPQPYGLAGVADCLVETPGIVQGVRQVPVSQSVRRFDVDRPTKRCDGLTHPVRRDVRNGQTSERLHVRRPRPERLFELRNRPVVGSGAEQRDGEERAGFGIRRHHCECLLELDRRGGVPFLLGQRATD